MQKRRLYLLIGIGVVGVLVALRSFLSREPESGGKRLSEWLDEIHTTRRGKGKINVAAEIAIEDIGTNALPYLIKWIDYEQPPWKRKMIEAALQRPLGINMSWLAQDRKFRRADLAVGAFEMLGPKGSSTLPTLVVMANKPGRKESARRAIAAMGFLGKDCLPPLLAFFTKPSSSELRFSAALSIGRLGSNGLPAVPFLIRSLSETNLGPDARYAVISALGQVKAMPELVVPALIPLLTDPEFHVRRMTTNVLQEIDPQALERPGR